MTESNETQRFDALLDAMLTKPPLEEVSDKEPQEDDPREGEG